tara:strand:- start:1156 stop:1404 length:249 start_codon:yes stop_codon:yes gene_type:complete
MPTSKTYVILTAAQALGIDFSKVLESSPSTLRWSNENSHTFVKFEGETPDFLEGKTAYTQAEILDILNDPEGIWVKEEEEQP